MSSIRRSLRVNRSIAAAPEPGGLGRRCRGRWRRGFRHGGRGARAADRLQPCVPISPRVMASRREAAWRLRPCAAVA